jgi:hypothetical protein
VGACFERDGDVGDDDVAVVAPGGGAVAECIVGADPAADGDTAPARDRGLFSLAAGAGFAVLDAEGVVVLWVLGAALPVPDLVLVGAEVSGMPFISESSSEAESNCSTNGSSDMTAQYLTINMTTCLQHQIKLCTFTHISPIQPSISHDLQAKQDMPTMQMHHKQCHGTLRPCMRVQHFQPSLLTTRAATFR